MKRSESQQHCIEPDPEEDINWNEMKEKQSYGTFSFLPHNDRWPSLPNPLHWVSSKMSASSVKIQIMEDNSDTDLSDVDSPYDVASNEGFTGACNVNSEANGEHDIDYGDRHLEAARELPYSEIYSAPLSFGDYNRKVLIPGERIDVKISDVERHPSRKLLNPNLYVIDLKHGAYKWTIKKRYHHFRQLHEQLLLFKAAMKIPVPTKRLKERRRSYRVNSNKTRTLPHLPKGIDALVAAPQLARRMVQLEKYLQNLLRNPIYRTNKHTIEFLELSHLSFVEELGMKGKESLVKKRSGGHRIPLGCCTRCCGGCYCEWAGHWSKRWLITKDSFIGYIKPRDISKWLITKDSFIGYIKPRDGRMGGLLLMDEVFSAKSGLNLLLKCWTQRKAKEWCSFINDLAEKCEYTKQNRYKSFAPVRNETPAKWFIDGADYLDAVADALESAQIEIFITDWWLSPEIYLKRPVTEGNRWRLDQILKRKAECGVKIFVLLYKEVEMAIGLWSSYSKHTLMKLHPNIMVLRHPDHVPGGVLLWAHHEKIVAIDQKTAFLGGIDLCYGRWDDYTHRLVDIGSLMPSKQSNSPGVLRKFSSTPERLNELHNADSNANDVKGQDEIDLAPTNLLAVPKFSISRTSVDEHLNKLGVQGMAKLWHGKDYTNFIRKDFVDLDQPLQDFIDRTNTPRMPWHDIAAVVYGKAARDVARHFILRWNATKLEKAKVNAAIPLLIPKTTNNVELPDKLVPGAVCCDCQILRSVSTWSAGIKHTENSIYWAYLSAIRDSKHYIYIENQFFISCVEDKDVYNRIADALYVRIMEAHRAKHKFRVMVVLPLLPAFEGEVGEAGATSILAITHWNYKSMSRGGNSLLEKLQREMENPEDYISFCGLRTYSELDTKLVTELVYVHSKLMIVDDRTVIIGSANINDRSMLGKRDSEIAVIVNDSNMKAGKMNGQDYQVGTYAYELRKNLFREHLGMLTNPKAVFDVTDPVCDEFFYNSWNKTAETNTEIFDKVFNCIPCNHTTTFDELKQYKNKDPLCNTDPEQSYKLLSGIRGYLVKIPLYFLCKENLEPSIATQEGMMPTKLWT
uniref:Phospholipase n=1 Tax=Saccoglossus kowalevskii TaxID=10224 RepID=A0ABM0LVD8_SACKO|nr:PREDICTED: phospholipase D1 [Saccoglossus kowalevskii]